jgi:molybdopterin molybdotransferase
VISLEEAQARVLAGCTALPVVRLPLDQALGHVLAEEIIADVMLPPFANSAMDGYAVRAADVAQAGESTPARLRVLGTLAAGHASPVVVGPGQALRIMTGAIFPEGADAVAIVETTSTEGDEVLVRAPAPPGVHVRGAGDDISAGQTLFQPGELLGAGHLGVLASLGREHVSVHRSPRVAVMSTGDELVEGKGPLGPGQIRDSNRHSLLALVRGEGFEAIDLGIVADDEGRIKEAVIDGLAGADALITSGGVSMGSFDYIKTVLGRLGRMDWMQVAIRPARPLAFGVIDSKPVFGLPGNPVSSIVSFELFARPGLRKMMGLTGSQLHRPRRRAIADEDLRGASDGRVHFARVIASQGADLQLHIRSSGGQGSHMLWAMARANALAVLPDQAGVDAGQPAEILLFD